MKSTKIDRRRFLSSSALASISVCGLCLCGGGPALAGSENADDATKKLDPKNLNYCGYSCPKDCKFLKGTLENDVELKKEAWTLWKIEERFGLAFDTEQAICYGCKTADKPAGIVLSRCTVRSCAQKKKLDCCIECSELEACDKELWKRFPDFKAQVVAARERYLSQT